MGFLGCLSFLLILLPGLICNIQAHQQHNVGGKHGWIVNPPEDYNHWAQRSRFQVGDTLYFKYKQGSDSVLEVTKEDYDACNTKNALSTFNDGHTVYKLVKSGLFYFVSGKEDNCKKGEKLIVLVMAERTKHAPISPPIMAPTPSGSAGAWPPEAATPSAAPTGGQDVNPPAVPPPADSGSGAVIGMSGLVVCMCTIISLIMSVSL